MDANFAMGASRAFSWAIVQFFHGSDYFIICNGPTVAAFGKVLPDKTVCVFICSSLIG